MKWLKRGGLLALLLAVLLVLNGCAETLSVIGNPGTDAGAAAEMNITARRKTSAPKTTRTPKPTKTPRPTATPAPTEDPDAEEEPEGPIIEPQAIANYLFKYGCLPDNFITKREAQELGWDRNYLSDVAPGMSIGGDHFGNYEGKLPRIKGRKYYEADCYYVSGRRGPERIVYSNDGHVWYTEDHYNTFVELFPEEV